MNIRKKVASLSTEQIQEIIKASDAAGMVELISLSAQFTPDEAKAYFTGIYKEFRSDLRPNSMEERKDLYKEIAKRLVSEWKEDPQNKEKRDLVNTFLEITSGELYLGQSYKNGLESSGYNIDERGVVQGINETYREFVQGYSEKQGIDIKTLEEKVGGIDMSNLGRAQTNLVLSKEEVVFIDDLTIEKRKTSMGKKTKRRSLRLALEVRNYFFEAGLEPNDLMKLWGLSGTMKEVIERIKRFALEGEFRDKCLNSALEMCEDKVFDDSEAFRQRAIKMQLPKKRPTLEEITKRNQGIIEEIKKSLKYSALKTSDEEETKSLILTGKPGTRSRAVNITYPNSSEGVTNVQMMYSFSPEQQFATTLAHELTHELHGYVVVQYCGGFETWNSLDSGIKELFAQLVGDSMKDAYKDEKKTDYIDNFYHDFVYWWQFPYAYSQLRFIEEFFKLYKDGSEEIEKLLSIEEQITQELQEMYVLKKNDRIFDLSKYSRALYSTDDLSDGLVYISKDLRPKPEAKPSGNTQEETDGPTVEEMMRGEWGAEWIYNEMALKTVVALYAQSAEDTTTEQVAERLMRLIEQGEEAVQKILTEKNIRI